MNSFISSSKRWLAVTLSLGLGLFVLFIGASEYLIRRHVEPADHFQIWMYNFLTRHEDSIAIGDSNTHFAFLGRPGFFNMSRAGLAYEETYEVIRRYHERQPLRRIILGVSYSTLRAPAQEMDQGRLYDRLRQRSSFDAIHTFQARHRAFLWSYWYTAVVKRNFTSRFAYSSLGHFYLVNPDENHTFMARPSEAIAIEADSFAHTIKHTTPENPAASMNGQKVAQTLAYLEREGVTVCVVTWPISSYLRDRLDPALVERVQGYFRSIATAHGARYVDMQDAAYEREGENFTSFTHATPRGAAQLTPLALSRCGFGSL